MPSDAPYHPQEVGSSILVVWDIQAMLASSASRFRAPIQGGAAAPRYHNMGRAELPLCPI